MEKEKKMRIKKLAVILLVAIFAMYSLFAGGSSDSSSSNNDTVTITYAFWGNPDAIGVEQDIIDEFEATHPNIKVETVVSAYNDYHSKLMTMIAGGMAPDVMRIDCYFFQDFVNLGACEPLEDLIEKTGFDRTIHPQWALDEASMDGTLYALPWGSAPLYLILNLDAFEKAGIDLPSYDWTLEDFEDILRQFKASDTGTYGFAFYFANNNPFHPFIWANGGNLFADDLQTYIMDQPEAVEVLQWIADMYQEGLMPRDSVSTTSADTLVRWFTTGSIAIMGASAQEILSVQRAGDTRFEVYPYPGGVETRTTVVKSNEVAISASSRNKDAAWEFLSFLRGNEGERHYSAAQRIPPSLTNDPDLWDLYLDPTKYPKTIKEVTDLINEKYSHSYQLRANYSEIEAATVPYLQQIVVGDATAQEAMTRLGARVREIVGRN